MMSGSMLDQGRLSRPPSRRVTFYGFIFLFVFRSQRVRAET